MNDLINKLKGTGVALITPFKSDFSIDHQAIKKIVDFVIDGGVNYLVVHGTTGEATSLTEKEKIESRRSFLLANDNRLPIIIGIGSNSTFSLFLMASFAIRCTAGGSLGSHLLSLND